MLRRALPVVFLLALGGCATVAPPYTAVAPGVTQVGDLQISPRSTWNEVSHSLAPFSRKDARVWTHDGLLLNRLLVIPAVPDGEALFDVKDQSAALPVFRADMLPNEIQELTESSMVKLLGEGDSTVRTENLRPVKFGEQRGLMFDFVGQLTDGPTYKGVAGGFIAGDKLYMIIYLGADPYYFEKHRDEVESIIRSARI